MAKLFRNNSKPSKLSLLLLAFALARLSQNVSAVSAEAREPVAAPRVAVIGAGVGGAFTALRLSEQTQLEQSPEMDVFEAEAVEGGRVQEYMYRGQALEMGASMFWDYNRYVKTAAESLGLTLQAHRSGGGSSRHRSHDRAGGVGEAHGVGPSPGLGGAAAGKQGGGGSEKGRGEATTATDIRSQKRLLAAGGGGGALSLWDGQRLVFNMSGSWWDVARAVVRYGSAALAYRWRVSDAFRRFQRVYDLQAAGVSWETPDAMLQQLGLYNETQWSSRDYLEAHLMRPAAWWLWGGRALIEEAVAAVGRCNYNQRTSQLNALAGLVSYGPAAYGSVWAIKGGNRQLVSGLLAASGARVLRGGRVLAARRHAGTGLWWLEVQVEGSSGEGAAAQVYGPYQAVVLAAPLVGSGLVIEEVEEAGEGDQEAAAGEEAGAGGRSGGSSAAAAGGHLRAVGEAGPSRTMYQDAAMRRRLLYSDRDYDRDHDSCSYSKAAEEEGADDREASASSTTPTAITTTASSSSSSSSSSSRSSSTTTSSNLGSGKNDTAALLRRPYQVTVTTFVAAGRLRPAFFNATALPPGLSAVLVTDGAQVPFTAVAARRPAGPNDEGGGEARGEGDGELVYKLFSTEPLTPELLEQLFEPSPGPAARPPRVLASRRWHAYPRFAPPERFPPFLLAPGLVYGNALEVAASAMEMAAVAAANSALLVVGQLQQLGGRLLGQLDKEQQQ